VKVRHDKQHRDVEFEAGDWVWLGLHHRSAVGITQRTNAKITPKFFGPFQVLSVWVRLPTDFGSHPSPTSTMSSMSCF
jgi:hypothetical protein